MRIWLLFAIQAIAYAGLAAEHLVFGTLTYGQLPLTLSLVGVAVVAYGLSVWQVEKAGGISLSTLLLGAVLFRALLLITLPTLSSDIYRYLWDGYVANNGVSPYAFPIDSPQLDYLTHPIRSQANHTWMASPYLPAAQWLFGRVTAWLPINALSMQLVMVLVDLLSGVLIMAILGMVGLPKYRALIYLWNPLVVVEIAQGAHIDGWMICLTMAAIWLTLRYGNAYKPQQSSSPKVSARNNGTKLRGRLSFLRRQESIFAEWVPAFAGVTIEPYWHNLTPLRASEGAKLGRQTNPQLTGDGTLPPGETLRPFLLALAPLFLAFATLTKILPAFLIAVLFWQWRWWRLFLFGGTVAGFLIFAGTRAGWGLTGELDGHGLFGALRIYGDQWNYNSGIFHWIEVTLGPNGWAGWEMAVANQWAKRIVAILLLSVLGSVWLMARELTNNVTDNRTLLRLMAVPFMAYALLTATMHPWYLLLLLSFTPFLAPGLDEGAARQRFQWMSLLPWLYLSAALFLSYLTYLDPENLREYEWIRRTEWVPTLILAGIALVWWASLLKPDETFTISK